MNILTSLLVYEELQSSYCPSKKDINLIIVMCDPATTCSGHGTCTEDGSCKCSDGFYGDSCSSKSISFTPYLFALDFLKKSTLMNWAFCLVWTWILQATQAVKSSSKRQKIKSIKINGVILKKIFVENFYFWVRYSCILVWILSFHTSDHQNMFWKSTVKSQVVACLG